MTSVVPFYTEEERLVIRAVRHMDDEFLENFLSLTRYSFNGFCFFYYRLPDTGAVMITDKHIGLVEKEFNKRARAREEKASR